MQLLPCPYCKNDVRPDRLAKHILSIHSRLTNASDAEKIDAIARATEDRRLYKESAARPKAPETLGDRRNRVMTTALACALPTMVRRNHLDRQRQYLDIYETGIVGSGIESLPACFCQCYLCSKWATRSLYRVPLKDDTYVDMAQDCFDALLGINEGNINSLRELVGLYYPRPAGKPIVTSLIHSAHKETPDSGSTMKPGDRVKIMGGAFKNMVGSIISHSVALAKWPNTYNHLNTTQGVEACVVVIIFGREVLLSVAADELVAC